MAYSFFEASALGSGGRMLSIDKPAIIGKAIRQFRDLAVQRAVVISIPCPRLRGGGSPDESPQATHSNLYSAERRMHTLSEAQQFLAGLKLGAAQTHGNLTLFPLLGDGPDGHDYVLLDEGLDGQLAQVTEVSEAGRVPELAFENNSDAEILLVDGDELVGASRTGS